MLNLTGLLLAIVASQSIEDAGVSAAIGQDEPKPAQERAGGAKPAGGSKQQQQIQPEVTESVSVPAEALAKTQTDGAGAGQAGIGFEYKRIAQDSLGSVQLNLRARVNLGANRFEVLNGKQADYAATILQPDLRGASAAADFAYAWQSDRVWFSLLGGFRLSPTMSWVTEQTNDDGSITRTTRDAIVALTQVGASFGVRLPGPTGAVANDLGLAKDVVFQIQAPVSLHALTGGVVGVGNGDFRTRTLGTLATTFVTFSPKILVRVGDFGLFAAMPIGCAVDRKDAVTGLTGFNVIIGAEVSGKVLEWNIPATGGKKERAADTEKQPSARRSVGQLSL